MDSTVQQILSQCPNLTYLNFSGTSITDNALTEIINVKFNKLLCYFFYFKLIKNYRMAIN